MAASASHSSGSSDASPNGTLFTILENTGIAAAVLRDYELIRRSTGWKELVSDDEITDLDGFLSLLQPEDQKRVAAAIDHAGTPQQVQLQTPVSPAATRAMQAVSVHPLGHDGASTLIVLGETGSALNGQETRVTTDEASASRYQDIFENAYVSLWEEDIRSLREAAARAEERGVTDIRAYLEENPDIVREAARNVRVLDVNAETLRLYGAATKDELIGSLDRIFIDDTVPLFIEEIAAVFEGRERLEAEIRVRTLTNEDRYVIVSFAIPKQSERFDHVLVSMIDITEKKREQQEREALFHLEHERHLLARTISHVTLSLTSLRHVDEVLDEILAAAVNLVPFESGNIALLRTDNVEPVRWIGYQESGGEELIKSVRTPIEELPADFRALKTQLPQVVFDTESDPDWRQFPETAWIRSCLIVPIVYQDEVRGFLQLDSGSPGRFSDADGEKLLPLAQAAAVAMENARLVERMEHEIGERKSAEKGLRRSLEEKELLVQEIHHRVKNNLAMVSSIIGLQKNELPDNPVLGEVFDELQARIRAIAAVHEQLHETGSISRVQLADYVREIIGSVRSSMTGASGNVTISHNLEQVVVTAGEAPPVGLVVTEAITNALKHAFPDGRGGTVSVDVSASAPAGGPRRVELRITDDGVGMCREQDAQSGAPHASSSLGVVLMKSFAQQLGGTLSFTHEGGTTIHLSFPTKSLAEPGA